MSYRVGVQFRTFRVFSLARRLFTDRLTPRPPPRVYISKSDLIGNAVQHRACRSAFKCQDVEFNQVFEMDVALPNAAYSEMRCSAMRLGQGDQIGQVVAPALAVNETGSN